MPARQTIQLLTFFTFFLITPVMSAELVDLNTLRTTALSGKGTAQYYLAESHYTGKGVPQNYVEALKLYTGAAEKGHMMAQYLVGVMYASGEGTTLNYPEGYAWMSLVADRGDSDAKRMMNIYMQKMSLSQINKAKQRAASLKEHLL